MPDENAKTYNSIFGRHLLVIDDDKNKLSIWMQIKFFYRNHCRCGLKVYSACLRMYVILFLLLFSDLCSSPSLENVIETVKKRESMLVSEYRYRIYIQHGQNCRSQEEMFTTKMVKAQALWKPALFLPDQALDPQA